MSIEFEIHHMLIGASDELKRFATGKNKALDGKCIEDCGADECYIACRHCDPPTTTAAHEEGK